MELEDKVMAEEAHTWWWVFLATGIIWLMLSFVILRLDVTSVKTVGYLIGMMFVLAALNEAMLASASNGGWKFVHYAMAVLFVGGAAWSFVNPGESVFALASILGFLLFFQGTVTIMVSVGSKDVNPLWGLGLTAGILELLLAFVVSQRYFAYRITLILVWAGLMAIFRGVEHIALAFSVRRAGKSSIPAGPPSGEMATA